jgi:mannose-6-phosphate isomerase-like protein (cupin superfamily)
VGIELTDTNETATLTLGEQHSVDEGLRDVAFKITMTSDILNSIMRREADAFALAGRSHIKESRPIDFELLHQDRAAEIMETIKGLATFYLNPGRIKTKQLRLDLAGNAHGAKPIPLVYWKGLRYAWYHIQAGRILNEDGEKDPWPQAFVVLKGTGKVHILDEILDIQPETVYYIPRNCTHQVHAKEAVELLWIAWDAE